jgi:hypothetical protein
VRGRYRVVGGVVTVVPVPMDFLVVELDRTGSGRERERDDKSKRSFFHRIVPFENSRVAYRSMKVEGEIGARRGQYNVSHD